MEKYTSPLNTTFLMSEHSKRKCSDGLISLSFFQVFPSPCSPHLSSVFTTAWGPPCLTHDFGPEPKMGIYEATSALPDRNTSAGQDCVVLATCGGDPALRRGGGGTNTEQKGYLFSLL